MEEKGSAAAEQNYEEVVLAKVREMKADEEAARMTGSEKK